MAMTGFIAGCLVFVALVFATVIVFAMFGNDDYSD